MTDSGVPEIISFAKEWHSEPYPFIASTRPELSATGKNIVITGGGTGIGRAVGVAFSKAGANSVTIIGRRADKLVEGAAVISAAATNDITQVLYKTADLNEKDQVDRTLESIVGEVSKVDVLVSNAGPVPVPGFLAHVKPDDLASSLLQNVVSTMNAIRAFLPLASPEPVLLNTSSSMAHWLPTSGMGIYTVSKAAALKLFDVVSRENPKLHVVNVQPGWVATDMNGHQNEAPDSPDLPG